MTYRIDWNAVAAIGQVVGAVATFMAVWVSLRLARKARVPDARLKVSTVLIISPGLNDIRVLMFSVTNSGERSIHVRTVGWQTGWFKHGPSWLKKQYAMQLTGGVPGTPEPPFELSPANEVSTYCLMANVEDACRERRSDPFFTRDYPWLGRRSTRVRASVYIGEGYTFYTKPTADVIKYVTYAEVQALDQT